MQLNVAVMPSGWILTAPDNRARSRAAANLPVPDRRLFTPGAGNAPVITVTFGSTSLAASPPARSRPGASRRPHSPGSPAGFGRTARSIADRPAPPALSRGSASAGFAWRVTRPRTAPSVIPPVVESAPRVRELRLCERGQWRYTQPCCWRDPVGVGPDDIAIHIPQQSTRPCRMALESGRLTTPSAFLAMLIKFSRLLAL